MWQSLFAPFQSVMSWALTFFYGITVHIGLPSYGLAIILLTVVIKMLLYPLTVKQVKSMKAMQQLAPRMKEIREKYKDNKDGQEKMQREVAALYKEGGVNPLASCLPMLVQMPFFIAIFFAIRDYSYVSNPSFLWIVNLAQANPSDPYYILPLLSGLTTYISTKQTMTDQSQQNKALLYVMPVMVGWFSVQFPAGLALYWVVSNIMQILQQWWLNRTPDAVQEGARS